MDTFAVGEWLDMSEKNTKFVFVTKYNPVVQHTFLLFWLTSANYVYPARSFRCIDPASDGRG